MVTHYSTLSATDFTKLFESCKSYHEHMLKVAVSYADVQDDETMFEWLLSYFDLFFPKSIAKSSSLDDIIEASPYGKAVSQIRKLCRVIATNNDNLKPKYEDLCKKYYGKSLQEKLEDEKQHRKDESTQVASEFESMIADAFKEVHEKVHGKEGKQE